MGERRIVLKLMNADGELIEKAYQDGQTKCVQLTSNRFVPFHSEESQVDAGKQLALFHVSPSSALRLEPFCGGVEVEPPFPELTLGSRPLAKHSVPYSSSVENSHHYIILRPEDIVHFKNHHRQVRYSVQPVRNSPAEASMPPAIFEGEDVQVKSSDPGPNVDKQPDQRSVADSETEDEGDPERTFTPTSETPATSRLTATREVKETPKHRNSMEEDAPFSTAQEPPVEDVDVGTSREPKDMPSSEIKTAEDAVEAVGTSSPTVLAKKLRTDRAKHSQASTAHVPSFSESDIENTSPSKKTSNNYWKHSRRTTPAKSANDGEGGIGFDAELGDPRTSPMLYPFGRAHEAAARSLANKRKAAPEDDQEDYVVTKTRKVSTTDDDKKVGNLNADVAAAKARTTNLAKASSQESSSKEAEEATPDGNDADSATADEESDDDGPSQVPAGRRVSSGRMPKAAQTEESEGEEIIAEPRKKPQRQTKSSPEVVVRPPRSTKAASKTPGGTPTSTATSSLSGKPPKILASQYKPSASLVKFLGSKGSLAIESVPTRRANFVCVVKDGKLVKTPKVLRSLALGKRIVTERWANDSAAAKELLDLDDYVHEEVADTVDIDRRNLFSGKVLFFTNAAVKAYGSDNWLEMKALATDVGASSIDSGTAGKGGRISGRNHIMYLGSDNDADATALIQDYDRVVYHKDIIREAVISGELDLEDDKYMLKATVAKKGRRG